MLSFSELNERQIISCSDGFYPAENSCQQCPFNCKRCRSRELCLECIDGKFGDVCELDCSPECRTCEPYISGSRWGRCIDCKPGLHGYQCMYNCSYCAGGLCSRDRCVNGCIDGWYEYQEMMCVKCPSTCEECDPWSWSEQRCTSCPPTKWGNLCDKACPSTCPSNNCDRHTGECACAAGTYLDMENNACVTCPENCRQCTSLASCSECKPGKKGPACQQDCVPHCLECKEGPGTDGRTYNPYHEVWELCSECEKGYHRNDRCYPCEEGCKDDCWWMPRSAVEECYHCKDGYYKDRMVPNRTIMKCFKCPTGCKNCNKNGECQSCIEGYFRYDQTCCPENCNSCTSPESCTSCRQGYRGGKCELSW